MVVAGMLIDVVGGWRVGFGAGGCAQGPKTIIPRTWRLSGTCRRSWKLVKALDVCDACICGGVGTSRSRESESGSE